MKVLVVREWQHGSKVQLEIYVIFRLGLFLIEVKHCTFPNKILKKTVYHVHLSLPLIIF